MQDETDRRSAINPEGLQFPKRQQTRDLIDVRAGQQHSVDRRVPSSISRVKGEGRFNLGAQIRRGIYQKPSTAVVAYRDLGLTAA